jgi:hypothetical protein
MSHFHQSARAWVVLAIVTIWSWQGTGHQAAVDKAAASPQQREGTAGRKTPKKILYFEGAPSRVAAFMPQNSWVWAMNAKVDTPAHERF